MESNSKSRVAELIGRAEGGMKEHYMVLVEGLLEAGVEVVALCSFPSKDRKKLKNRGAIVLPFTLGGGIRLLRDISTILRLSKKLKKNRIDVLHCHGFRAGLVGRIAASLAGCHCIYTMHNFLPMGLGRGSRGIAAWVERKLCSITNKIIVVSNALKQEAVKGLNIESEKIKVIYNGVVSPHSLKGCNNVREKWGIEEDERVIGTVARLIPSKGIEILIDVIPRVVAEFPKAKFMVLGDGPIREGLRQRAREQNCHGNIIFTGHREYIWYYYDIFDIFVLPSLSEGLGISILEALAMGKPVIATRVGGIPEIIEHERNGYLIEPGNRHELSDAILYFLAHPEKAREYGDRGRQTLGDKFSPETMIVDTLEVIEELMEG